MQRPKSPTVQSVEKALRVLGVFSHESPQLSLNEIAAALGMHRSNAYRLLITLEKHDFLRQVADSNKYEIGSRAFEVGSLFLIGDPLLERAGPILEALMQELGWTAQVNVLERGEILVVATVESPSIVRIASRLGMRMPVHCTASGKAILSRLPAAEVEALLGTTSLHRYTHKTIISLRQFKSELKSVSTQGYAVNDEEWIEGLFALAVPVRSFQDHRAAIAVACPVQLVYRDQVEEIARTVQEAAQELSVLLGAGALASAPLDTPVLGKQ